MTPYFRTLWWSIRQRIVPLRGMRVNWRGYRFLLFLDDRVYCFGQWSNDFPSLHEVDLLSRQLLKPRDSVLDVGANYGYTATIFARMVGAYGKVIAIEAAPHTVARMRRQLTAAKASNVKVVSRAVGDTETTATMQVSFEGRQDCQHVVFSSTDTVGYRDYLTEQILVRVSTLDAITAQVGCQDPCLIKIDVEGSELAALRGAEKLLQAPDPPWLFLEIQKETVERSGSDLQHLLDLLQSYSDTFYAFDGAAEFVQISHREVNERAEQTKYLNILVRPPRGKYKDRQL